MLHLHTFILLVQRWIVFEFFPTPKIYADQVRTEERMTEHESTSEHGFLFWPKSPDISDISFLSVGADKKTSIFFV